MNAEAKIPVYLSDNILSLRKRRNLTQEQLARS